MDCCHKNTWKSSGASAKDITFIPIQVARETLAIECCKAGEGNLIFFISSVSRGKQKKKFSVQMKGLIVFKELERQRWPQNGQHLLQIPFSYFLLVHFWCFTSTFWKYEIELAGVILHGNRWVLELFFLINVPTLPSALHLPITTASC